MLPALRHIARLVLAGSIFILWPVLQGCSHTAHNSLLQGNAPNLQNGDTRVHSRNGANPNAPYLVASANKPPQLVKREDETASNASASPCDEKNLTVTEIAATMNGQYHAVKLAFYNQGLTSCRIGGFPNVSLLDQHGNPVASMVVDHITESALKAKLEQRAAQQASATQPQGLLVIAPRGEAWFQMGWSTGEGCPEVARISVSAPGASETFTVNHPISVCDGRIEITSLHSDEQ